MDFQKIQKEHRSRLQGRQITIRHIVVGFQPPDAHIPIKIPAHAQVNKR